jgi:hypothetical protein
MTWWGIAVLAAHLLATAVRPVPAPGTDDDPDVLGSTQLVVALTVLAGTWAMSFTECGMLLDAYNDYGFLGYTLGNFALHYYPVTRGLTQPINPTMGRVTAAVALVTAYTTTMDATDVYSCDAVPAWVAVVVIPLSAVVAAVAIIAPAPVPQPPPPAPITAAAACPNLATYY